MHQSAAFGWTSRHAMTTPFVSRTLKVGHHHRSLLLLKAILVRGVLTEGDCTHGRRLPPSLERQ